jgi:hypothetical protein
MMTNQKFALIGIIFVVLLVNSTNIVSPLITPGNTVPHQNDSLGIEKLSSITVSGHLSGIQVIDDVAFIGDHTYGFKIYNVSNPSSPALLGQTADPGTYHDLYVEGSLAYLADLEDGLIVFDISDLSNPSRLGDYDVGEQNAAEVQVVGNLVYLAEFGPLGGGLEIFNASNPSNLVKIGEYKDCGIVYNVQVIGEIAYLAAGLNQLITLNVSDPTHPAYLGTYHDGERVRYFYVEDQIAYVTCSNDGFKTIDVSDPTNPQLLGEYSDLGFSIGVFKSGNLAYVGEWDDGLAIFDVSDPTNLQLLVRYTQDGGVSSIFVEEDLAYVATSGTTLIILRLDYNSGTNSSETNTDTSSSETNTGSSSSETTDLYFPLIVFVFTGLAYFKRRNQGSENANPRSNNLEIESKFSRLKVD